MLNLILILQTIISLNSAIPYNVTRTLSLPVELETNICAERKTPGLICESCDRMALCVKINDKWQTYPVEPCDTDNGLFCNIQERRCSKSPGPCNRLGYEANFACTSDGIYPDPYDCQKYHMCYHAQQSQQKYHLPIAGTANCNGNTAYSPATSDCSAKINDPVCKIKQYECRYSGDNNAWPGNENIFYICQPDIKDGQNFLYPTLYRCAPHEIYNGINCINVNLTTKSSITTLPPTLLTTKDQLQTTIQKPGILSCENHEIGISSDPNNCRAYYYCGTQHGIAKHYTCPHGTFYNIKTSACTFGDCV